MKIFYLIPPLLVVIITSIGCQASPEIPIPIQTIDSIVDDGALALRDMPTDDLSDLGNQAQLLAAATIAYMRAYQGALDEGMSETDARKIGLLAAKFILEGRDKVRPGLSY